MNEPYLHSMVDKLIDIDYNLRFILLGIVTIVLLLFAIFIKIMFFW